MPKDKIHKHPSSPRRTMTLLLVLFSTLTFFIALVWAGWITDEINYNSNQIAVTQERELQLPAIKLQKIPLPMDAKTGDFYISELKLMLPAKDEDLRLNYGHLPSVSSDYGKYDVSVSSDFVFARAAGGVYAAQDMDTLFKALIPLQACQRGVRIIEVQTQELTANPMLELKATVDVGNDRTIFLYSEKLCPDLEDVVYRLKNLRAY